VPEWLSVTLWFLHPGGWLVAFLAMPSALLSEKGALPDLILWWFVFWLYLRMLPRPLQNSDSVVVAQGGS
jgi:hypothetical protein